jgi:hypothetical protein
MFVIVFLAIISIIFIISTIRLVLILFKIEDAIEESLDIIDSKYENISKILETPVYYDSQEIKQVVKNLVEAKESLLTISNIISLNKTEEFDDSEK